MTVFEVTDLIHSIRPDLTDISLATPDVVLFTDGGHFQVVRDSGGDPR